LTYICVAAYLKQNRIEFGIDDNVEAEQFEAHVIAEVVGLARAVGAR